MDDFEGFYGPDHGTSQAVEIASGGSDSATTILGYVLGRFLLKPSKSKAVKPDRSSHTPGEKQ